LCNLRVAVHFSVTDRQQTESELTDCRLQEGVFVSAVRSVALLEDGELCDSLGTVSLLNGVNLLTL